MKRLQLFLLTGVMVGLGACHKAEPPAAPLRAVMVMHPVATDQTIGSYAGEVKARQESALAFRVAGKVSQRLVDVGDRVQAGQVLATLDNSDANQQLSAARAQLESAQSAAKTANTELGRYKQLIDDNAVSRSQFDQIQNQYNNARAALNQAQANYQVTANQTDYTTLRADKSGVITARNVEVGQVMAAGQAAYTLALDGDREVLIGVPEQTIKQFHVKQPVQVSLWSNPTALLPAYVREIAAAADSSRTFAVRVALVDGHAPVSIGQSARVFTAQPAASNVMQLPLSAVTAEDQQAYVWVFDQASSTLRKANISIGTYGRDSVPVLSGLTPNDWVVVAGVHLLHAGQKVNAVTHDNQPINPSQPSLAKGELEGVNTTGKGG